MIVFHRILDYHHSSDVMYWSLQRLADYDRDMMWTVVKVRHSALQHRSATSDFSRAALRHVYVCRGELQSCAREGKGVRVQICRR